MPDGGFQGVSLAKRRKTQAVVEFVTPEMAAAGVTYADLSDDPRAKDPELYRALSALWAAHGTAEGPAAMLQLNALLNRRTRQGRLRGVEPGEMARAPDGTEVARWSDDQGPPELGRHAPVVEVDIYELSPLTGRNEKRKVRRTLDVLDRLLKASQITQDEFDAGRRFQTEFDLAHLDPARAADLGRIPGGGGAADAGRIATAKDTVWRLMSDLGGHGAPVAEAAWWVLGARLTVQDFARRQRWGAGKDDHMNPMTAAGLVIGALNVLGASRRRRRA